MKDKMKRITVFFTENQKLYKWEWVLLALLIFLPFASCFYGDTNVIVLYENHFWGAIFQGDGILSYYDYVYDQVQNGLGIYATYDFPMYLILGVWGLPLWIFWGSKGEVPTMFFMARLYGKCVYLIPLAITVFLVYKICRELKMSKERAMWGAFLYESSMMVYVAICLNGQTDIIGMVFILLGLWAYIKDERIKFLVFFALAVPFKQYALFLFVPLLVLREKKIWNIILNAIGSLSVLIVSNLLFDPLSPGIERKKIFELEIFNRLMANRLPLLDGSVPTPVVLLLAVCVFCFLKEVRDEEERKRYAVFIPLLTMGCMFISFESSSYWYLHLAPYLSIMLVYNTNRTRHNLLFETVAMICLTLANYASRPWAFEVYAYCGMLLEKLFGNYNALETPFYLENFCQKIGITKYCGAFFSTYVVLLMSIIFINRPSQISSEEDTGLPMRGYAYLRMFANAAVAYIPGLLYLYNVYLAGKV